MISEKVSGVDGGFRSIKCRKDQIRDCSGIAPGSVEQTARRDWPFQRRA